MNDNNLDVDWVMVPCERRLDSIYREAVEGSSTNIYNYLSWKILNNLPVSVASLELMLEKLDGISKMSPLEYYLSNVINVPLYTPVVYDIDHGSSDARVVSNVPRERRLEEIVQEAVRDSGTVLRELLCWLRDDKDNPLMRDIYGVVLRDYNRITQMSPLEYYLVYVRNVPANSPVQYEGNRRYRISKISGSAGSSDESSDDEEEKQFPFANI